MSLAGHAMPAAAADDVAFSRNKFARIEVVDVRADLDNFTDELMSDRHRYRNGLTRPVVPLIDVNVGPTDPCAQDANTDIVDSNCGFGNVLQPKAGLGVRFNKCLHGQAW